MCGIAGVWNWSEPGASAQMIRRMAAAIAHRGPDGEGFRDHANGLSFGHRRLSVIDLSELAAQPMNYLGKYVITYNGEIYNYIEIREVLLKQGYTFASKSDTEVIMAAYDYWGISCLDHFDGMFAFALYDTEANEVFCARDRFGEKPFYYLEEEGQFLFASEMKSFRAAGKRMDTDDFMVYNFMNFGLHDD
jgi:asparagine synthase (glutamine-hydrolysing)